jgi:hypothetical protein
MIRVLGGLLTRPVAGRRVLTRASLDVPLRDGKAAAMTGARFRAAAHCLFGAAS